jgi:hypothetical protein
VNGPLDGYVASLRAGRIALVPTPPEKTFTRKIVESVVVVAAGVGLMAFSTFGSFTDQTTPFPPAPVDGGH